MTYFATDGVFSTLNIGVTMKPTNLRVVRRYQRWALVYEYGTLNKIRELATPFMEKPTGNDLLEVTRDLGLSVEECLSIPLEV